MLVQRRALAAALRAHSSRAYATAASGPIVFAQDAGQPTSSITILVKAGTRFEPTGHSGIAHVLKNFSFKSSKERSALRTVREAELYGGVLTATLTREYLALTADFLRGDEGFFLPLLASSIVSPKLVGHELHEFVWPTVAVDTASAVTSGEYTVLEMAHAIAFRSGLGHALLNPPHAHEPSIEAVKDYASKVFTQSNVAIIGSGLDQSKLESLASHHFGSLPSGSSISSPASKYFGGSTVSPSLHPTLFIGYGVAGTPSAGVATLAAHLATKPRLPWSNGLSPLSSLPSSIHAESVLLPYSDATLFGVVISGKDSAALKQGGEAVVKAIKEAAGGLKEEAVTRAKARAKFAAAVVEEGKAGDVAKGAAKLEGKEWNNLVDEVEKLDVKAFSKFATDLLKGKPTVVALGDINTLPHPDEIGF